MGPKRVDPQEACFELPHACPQFDARVLLVENSQMTQFATHSMLEELGCRPVVTGDGTQALEALVRERFDLILMDWQLPGMDGHAATVELRRHAEAVGSRVRVPVIALTATDEERERCMAAGVDDCLSKPFQRDALAAKLARWLPARAVQRGAEQSSDQQHPPRDPAIERKALDAIRDLAGHGTPDILDQIIRLYLDSTPELLSKLRLGLKKGHAEVVRTAAHTLKSSSAIVGANRLAELCKRIETAARSDAFTFDPVSMEQLDTEYARVRIALERALEDIE